MRKDKDKCKNKHETTIGKIIYGFLLFLPLFAIGVTCLVNTFNAEARAEHEIHYKYETNEVNSIADLVNGNIYHLTYNKDNRPSNNEFLYIYEVYNLGLVNWTAYTSNNTYSIPLFTFTSSTSYYYNTVVNNQTNGYTTSDSFECDIVYRSNTNFTKIEYLSKCENIPIEVVDKDLDNIFYKAINKVQQSPLFNWAYNSVIYTGMNSFTTGLSITTPFIPLLMTYWLIISIVYFLYDIVLVILVVLHKKIHALEESI